MRRNYVLSNKKKMTIGILVVFITLLIIREVGIIDVNLYKTEVNKNFTATLVRSCYSESVGKEETTIGKDISYYYDLYNNDEKLIETNYIGNKYSIKLNAFIVTGKFEGNYYLPLYKKFKVSYTVKIENAQQSDKSKINGDMSGTVEVLIKGVCSKIKAKEIANDSIILEVRKYLDSVK